MEDPRRAFESLFGRPRALLGMLHAGALPGTPHAREPVDALIERAVSASETSAVIAWAECFFLMSAKTRTDVAPTARR